MKKWGFAVFILLLLFSAGPMFAQECTQDSFFPEAGNCGYDISDYRLDMAWDPDGDRWEVSEEIMFTAEWDTAELHFDFTDSYEIYELKVNSEPADFELKGQDLTVRFPFTHDTGYRLHAGFRGKLNYGFLFDENGEKRDENGGFCMVNEPTNAWRFYICNDHPKDKAAYRYSFTVPASFTPAGVGRLLEIREADGTVIRPEGEFSREASPKDSEGTVTFTYEATEPMAPYLFTVCAFPYDLKQKTLDSGVVELDFVDNSLGDSYEAAWKLTGEQEAIIGMFESWLGAYPFRDTGAIISPTRLGAALETQTRPLYDASTLSEEVFAHELIHQWLGDLISVEDWSDVWIKEGAATFGEYLYTQHFKGQEAFENLLEYKYDRIRNGPGWTYDTESSGILDWLLDAADGSDFDGFDRQASLDAAAAFCRADEDGKQRIDPASLKLPEGKTVSAEDWIKAVAAPCRTIRLDHNSYKMFYEMTGVDLGIDSMPDHYAGPKEISSEPGEMYGQSPYAGASFVYYALYCRLGVEGFKQALKLMLDRYQYSTVNEEKFISVFSEAAGEDFTDFIRPWLYYGEGHIPDLPETAMREEAGSN